MSLTTQWVKVEGIVYLFVLIAFGSWSQRVICVIPFGHWKLYILQKKQNPCKLKGSLFPGTGRCRSERGTQIDLPCLEHIFLRGKSKANVKGLLSTKITQPLTTQECKHSSRSCSKITQSHFAACILPFPLYLHCPNPPNQSNPFDAMNPRKSAPKITVAPPANRIVGPSSASPDTRSPGSSFKSRETNPSRYSFDPTFTVASLSLSSLGWALTVRGHSPTGREIRGSNNR